MPVSRFYTANQLGPKRHFTPEGFLVCLDTPIARTGTLLYAPGEVPIDPGRDGVIGITREPEDVFSDQAIRSFEGKPVTNDHPPLGIKVDPKNWRQLAIGDVHNVRRGNGLDLDDQYLYADMVIKDAKAIQDVLDGKVEVSAGYDAEYEQLAPGRGRQHDIIGNHVALVDKGRCGPHCSIGDSDTMAKRASWFDRVMKAHRTHDTDGLVMELQKVPDMLGEVISDDATPGIGGGESGHQIHLNFNGINGPGKPSPKMPTGDDGEDDPQAAALAAKTPGGADPAEEAVPAWASALMQRIETIEQAVMLLAQDESEEGDGNNLNEPVGDPADDSGQMMPGKVGDDAGEIEGSQKKWPHGDPGTLNTDRARRARVGDSSSLAASFQDMIARAAVLSPGTRMPTFDADKGARLTVDAMCNFRRGVLARAWSTDDGREVIGSLYQKRKADFSRDAMTCDAVTVLYNGASELLARNNTQDSSRRLVAVVMDKGREVQSAATKLPTISELNAKARARYGISA